MSSGRFLSCHASENAPSQRQPADYRVFAHEFCGTRSFSPKLRHQISLGDRNSRALWADVLLESYRANAKKDAPGNAIWEGLTVEVLI